MNQPPEAPYPPGETGQPQYPSGPAQPPQPRPTAVQISRVRPVVTYSIIVITVIVFLLQLASVATLGGDYPAALGAKVNELIQAGQLWRLITPLLLHSTSFYPHVLFNMYALYSIGRGLEEEYGHFRFLILYLLGGFAGNVASFLMSSAASYGASTAIFGLLGAEAVLVYQNRRLLRNFRPVLFNILGIAAINLIIGLTPGIDNWGHLGGLIGGSLFAWFAGPLWELEGFAPNYKLVDRRSINSVVTSGFLIAALTAAVAVFTITTRGK